MQSLLLLLLNIFDEIIRWLRYLAYAIQKTDLE